ncbi:MAG: TonB-dependent receptor [Pedobacter sp.]|nr:MAG: TonB-dependent receptor [Pedobacter sp.]
MHQRDYDAFLFRKADGAADYTRETFGPDILGVTDQYRKEINPTFYSTLTYDTKIGENHNLKFLAGYEQLSNRVQGLRGRRINSVAQELDELGGYLAAGESLFFNHPRLPGNIAPQEWSMQSFFGRVNYDFKGKYLLEANLRYDGTSKVSPDYRWGVFPSVSAGWIISQEDFFRDNVSWVDNFKLRASYGTLGNQDVGTYLYQDNLTINGVLYPFGNSTVQQGAVNNIFRDQSIRWESSSVLDFGLDLEIKRGLLGVTFDWFRRSAFDILSPPQAPLSLGVLPQTINNGEMRSQGVELELYHRNKIGDFNYGANFQISTARNKVTDIKIPRVRRGDVRRVGDAFDAHYLFEWDGIFQVEDIGNPGVPVHALNPSPKAGAPIGTTPRRCQRPALKKARVPHEKPVWSPIRQRAQEGTHAG